MRALVYREPGRMELVERDLPRVADGEVHPDEVLRHLRDRRPRLSRRPVHPSGDGDGPRNRRRGRGSGPRRR